MERITLDELLKKDIDNKVIAFPTDTVYGVGCKINDFDAIDKIYEMKERDHSKPLAILTSTKDLADYVFLNDKAIKLMNKYWPGALTIIFKKKDKIDNIITANLDTVGFRMPNSKIALKILDKFGMLCTTSVNKSGRAPLNDVEQIAMEFGDYIDYLVVDEETKSNVSSTVVDCTCSSINIIRYGDIKLTEMEIL